MWTQPLAMEVTRCGSAGQLGLLGRCTAWTSRHTSPMQLAGRSCRSDTDCELIACRRLPLSPPGRRSHSISAQRSNLTSTIFWGVTPLCMSMWAATGQH